MESVTGPLDAMVCPTGDASQQVRDEAVRVAGGHVVGGVGPVLLQRRYTGCRGSGVATPEPDPEPLPVVVS